MLQVTQQIWAKSEPVRKQLWLHWHHRAGQKVPIFLVGCGRSGTNMISDRLGRSWEIELYNEDHPAAFDNYYLKDLATIETLVQENHANAVLFKPIRDTYQTNLLLSHFANAKAIFVIRHYDDVINSAMKKFGVIHWMSQVKGWLADDFAEFSASPPSDASKDFIRSRYNDGLNPESGAALFWWFRNHLFFDLGLDQNENVRLVQYEAVVSEAQKELSSLCEFLEIKFQPSMVENVRTSSVRRDSRPLLDAQIRQDCEELWCRLLNCVHDQRAKD
jgi:hypothetical protein